MKEPGQEYGNYDAEGGDQKTEDHHFGIPCFIDIDLGDILEQKGGQWDDEHEFVHAVDKCFIKKSDPSEKISEEQGEKDGHGNIETENKIVHKKKASLR